MKRIGLVLFFTGYWLLATGFYTYVHAQQETLEILTYYPAPYGVYQKLDIQSSAWDKIDLITTDGTTTRFARIGATLNAPSLTTNARWTGTAWTRDTDSLPSFAYSQRTNAFRHEFRVAPAGTGNITWTTAMVIDTDGQIGIETTNPTNDLSFGGDVRRMIGMERRTTSANGSILGITAGGAFLGGNNLNGGDLLLRGGISTGTGGSNIQLMTATPGTSGNTDHLPTTKMFIKGDGKVGIGTTNPTNAMLEVQTGTGTGIYSLSSTGTGIWGVSGAAGTGVYGGAAGAGRGIYGSAGVLGYAGYFEGRLNVTSTISAGGTISAVLTNVVDRTPGVYDMNYDSNTNTIGYDVAELFDTNEEVEPGDILIIDNNGKLKQCDKPNDSKVAGIVSNTPAILFEGGKLQIAPEPFKFVKGNKPPLSLSGRVLCNASAENGHIKPGDLLTTSPTPGHAMKAKPIGEINGYPIYPQGCIIGKALEPLKEGKGKILVLVCLM